MSVSNRLETIDPRKAAEYLKRNKKNRRVNPQWVERLARAITDGKFVTNGDSIKFDHNDNMIDGQHRMLAVIKSGKSIETYVTRGLTPETFDTIDQGLARSLAHILSREGVKHYATVAAATKWLVSIGDDATVGSASKYTNLELHQFVKSHPEIHGSVEYVLQFDGLSYSRGMFSALHVVFARKNREIADKFMERVLGGIGLSKSMVEYKLRHLMEKDARAVKQYTGDDLCTIVVKVWNSVRSGKTLKCLKVASGEKRPKVQ